MNPTLTNCDKVSEGIGTWFVESLMFKFFNKIAYGVYLTQFPIFFYNVGVQRHSEHYTPLLLVSFNFFFERRMNELTKE
ncbi:jg12886 [Pararge aegeria aegeria]|uniref:Jg12886 protein n=1 Tax=Pararge aegeria aegeria TaxID=348720 RepID=A0A8S4S709_9NEOP|nr:jg12886 [Pararge aegeria aegeria]